MYMLTMMSSILFILLFLFTTTQCQWTLRQYLIDKDFFNGFKAGEFSIYDASGNRLIYRFETQYAFTQMADLYAYPNQQKVASIQHIWSPWRYDAEIRVFDPFINQWIIGRITQVYFTLYPRYQIQYAGRSFFLEKKGFSFQLEFRDGQIQDYVLAHIRQRVRSLLINNQYELRIFSNDIPDPIYILAVAAFDYNRSRRRHTQG